MTARTKQYAEAFRVQAKSDFDTFELLAAQEWPECHCLHYLQMATEKICKAYRMKSATPDELNGLMEDHGGFANFFELYRHSTELRRFASPKLDAQAFEERYWAQVPLARRIEALAPAIAGKFGENPEYPWDSKQGRGEVVAPARHGFGVLEQLQAEHRFFVLVLEAFINGYEELSG